MSQPLSRRARAVLFAVVTEFTATGEPVGSRTLARKYAFDLSAATIRNVLADLEEAGYLAQPHTSAGRVPTDAAYRLFVDALVSMRKIPGEDLARIAGHFEDMPAGSDLLRETGRLLSDLTGVVGVVSRPRTEARQILRLRFVPTRPREVLVVVVFVDGTVENRFVTVERTPADRELERLHNVVEELGPGRTLLGLRDELSRLATSERAELEALARVGEGMVSAALGSGARRTEVVIEGQARVLERAEYADGDRARDLMRALEEREQLVTLLDRALEATDVQVYLGSETEDTVGHALSLVAAPYHEDGRAAGSVGVIGPTRMDYTRIVPLVGATAEAVSAALQRATGGEGRDRGPDGSAS